MKIDKLLYGSLATIIISIAVSFYGRGLLVYPEMVTFVDSIAQVIGLVWRSILLGMVMVALLSRLPHAFVIHVLGRKAGAGGIARAAVGGVMLDVCNHGILMVARKLYERGVSLGQMMAFLIASPWNSFSLLFILIALLGFGWALTFTLLSMVIAILSGLIFDFLVRRGVLPQNPHRIEVAEDFRFWAEGKKLLGETDYNFDLLVQMIKDGFNESKMVLRWLFFGVVLTALVRVLLTPDIFSSWFGPTLLGLMSTLVAATLIEICSEGSTTLAADFTLRANAIGNSFAFLMGGVATDYTEIVVVREATLSWKIAFFLPLITLPQIILLSYLMNLYA